MNKYYELMYSTYLPVITGICLIL